MKTINKLVRTKVERSNEKRGERDLKGEGPYRLPAAEPPTAPAEPLTTALFVSLAACVAPSERREEGDSQTETGRRKTSQIKARERKR